MPNSIAVWLKSFLTKVSQHRGKIEANSQSQSRFFSRLAESLMSYAYNLCIFSDFFPSITLRFSDADVRGCDRKLPNPGTYHVL